MMKIVRNWQCFPDSLRAKGTVVLIGSFDGLHIGHQALITLAKQQSKDLNLPVVMVTFEPSPKHYFLKQKNIEFNRLLGFYDKVRLLAAMGLDYLVILKFNEQMLNLSPNAFLDHLNTYLNPKVYCMGQDFQFGKNRAGDIFTLQQYAREHNQLVGLLPTIEDKYSDQKNTRISSTLLRTSLAQGNLITATRLLNRPYRLSGKVSIGKQLGRTIGVKTANINLKSCPIPLRGVYAVRITKIEQRQVNYLGMANIGIRPTVHQDNQLVLEVHIFDQELELYGKRIEIEFVKKIRDEQKFPNLEVLKQQITKDSENARLIMSAF